MTDKNQLPKPLDINYLRGAFPKWVENVIEESFGVEREDARAAGALGFMSRALILATMPYRDPKCAEFKRANGDFRLRIVSGYEGGIPYGIYPRLLMSWVTSEAVRTNSQSIELGDSLRLFLRDVLDIRYSGGVRGTGTRVLEQMKRLFSSLITAGYVGNKTNRGFVLRNIMIADQLSMSDEAVRRLQSLEDESSQEESPIWTPQTANSAADWKSELLLSKNFFDECVAHPVPFDLRIYKALRGSAMAMDIYQWLNYRLSYAKKKSKPIPWAVLQMQFGSSLPTDEQGVRNFKKAFLKSLKVVHEIYPDASMAVDGEGFVLMPRKAKGVVVSKPEMPQQVDLLLE